MKATTVKEFLIAAKWILEHKGWCQGAYARDKNGIPCSIYDGVSFCLSGLTLVVEAESGVSGDARRCLQSLVKEVFIYVWNDEPSRTKKQVLKLLDKAIEQAE